MIRLVYEDALEIIDTVYASVVEPDNWQSATDMLRQKLGGAGIVLQSLVGADFESDFFCYSGGGEDGYLDQFLKYYYRINPYVAGMKALPPGQIALASDLCDRAVAMRSEFVNDYFLPQDFSGDGLATKWQVDRNTQYLLTVSSLTNMTRTDLDMARRLVELVGPHVGRAVKLSHALARSWTRIQAASTFFHAINIPVFVLDRHRSVVEANHRGESLLGAGEVAGLGRDGAFHLRHTRADRMLDRAIRYCLNGGAMAGPLHFPVAPDGRLCVLYAVLMQSRFSKFQYRELYLSKSPRSVALFMMMPGEGSGPVGAVARAILGFTETEARVADWLISGGTTRNYAERHGVSYHTVRNHLSSMLGKAQVTRQAELIALLTRLSEGLPAIAGNTSNP